MKEVNKRAENAMGRFKEGESAKENKTSK